MGVMRDWKYISTHFQPRKYMKVSGELHPLNILPRYLLNRKPDGPSSRSGHFGENISSPYRESNDNCPARGLITNNNSNDVPNGVFSIL
jgi:hypothetical protein